jgi:hypothetical protein
MILSLLAYGYNDLFTFFKYIVLQLPESIARQFHLYYFIFDTFGGQYTGYSHGWFRNFLVEPHSTLALSILLVIIILVKKDGMFTGNLFGSLFGGLLLGIIFSIDAFIGVISISWYTLTLLIESWNRKMSISRLVSNVVVYFSPVALIFIILYTLKIINPGSSYLILKPYFKMILCSPIYFFIDYGPICLLAVIGIYLLFRNRKIMDYSPFIILAIICLFFMFFVNLAYIGSTQMIRKGGMIIRIPLILFSGISIKYLFDNYLNNKAYIILYSSILLALPTPFIDIYMLSNWKAKTGVSFVKQEDFKAYQWIKEKLPEDCIIQDYPNGITPLLAFGERRVSLGDWHHAKSSGNRTEQVASRFKEIRQLFETDDINLVVTIMKKYPIDYIYLNPETRKIFIKGSKKFDIYTNTFKKVYSENEISIYKVNII